MLDAGLRMPSPLSVQPGSQTWWTSTCAAYVCRTYERALFEVVAFYANGEAEK
jgi:hypothetical protein